MEISYTVWNMRLILSHPPTLLGQCPKFDRIYFLMASLIPMLETETWRSVKKKICMIYTFMADNNILHRNTKSMYISYYIFMIY